MMGEANPAEVRAGNSSAMNRGGYDAQDIDAVKDAFRRLFRDNGGTMTEKVASVRKVLPGVTAVTALCDALIATADGVHGRALEHTRLDDKRAAEVREPSVSGAP